MKIQPALLSSLAALTVTFAAAASVPAYAEPPPWAPAHGYRAKQVREYRYVYYPAQQVYYEPSQQMWFWMNGGAWQFGLNLPLQYRGYVSSGVPVVLHSPRPYVEHVFVEERYGRPWRQQHGYERGYRHEHHDRHDDERREEHHGGGHGHHRD